MEAWLGGGSWAVVGGLGVPVPVGRSWCSALGWGGDPLCGGGRGERERERGRERVPRGGGVGGGGDQGVGRGGMLRGGGGDGGHVGMGAIGGVFPVEGWGRQVIRARWRRDGDLEVPRRELERSDLRLFHDRSRGRGSLAGVPSCDVGRGGKVPEGVGKGTIPSEMDHGLWDEVAMSGQAPLGVRVRDQTDKPQEEVSYLGRKDIIEELPRVWGVCANVGGSVRVGVVFVFVVVALWWGWGMELVRGRGADLPFLWGRGAPGSLLSVGRGCGVRPRWCRGAWLSSRGCGLRLLGEVGVRWAW